MRSFRKLTALLLVLLLTLPILLPVRAQSGIFDGIVTDARGIVLLNPQTGAVLMEKDADTRMYPASTTKLMTALLVLENCENPETETVTLTDSSILIDLILGGGVHMNMVQGETFKVIDLLTATLIPSYCDAAQLLAYHFGGGSVEAFVEQMNKKAGELGLTNTHFCNPHGLHQHDHYSTPRDIATIMRAALQYPLFTEILRKRSCDLPATNKSAARHIVHTTDAYYPFSPYYSETYVGGKSGFTGEAGRCLVTYAEQDGTSFILALFGANLDLNKTYEGNACWSDTYNILTTAFDRLENVLLFRKGEQVGEVPVLRSYNVLPAVAEKDVYLLREKGTDLPDPLVLKNGIEKDEVEDGAIVGCFDPAKTDFPNAEQVNILLSYDGSPIKLKNFIVLTFELSPVLGVLLILAMIVAAFFLICLILRWRNMARRRKRKRLQMNKK